MRTFAIAGAIAVFVGVIAFAVLRNNSLNQTQVASPAVEQAPTVAPDPNDPAQIKEAAELASRQKEIEKLWKGIREFGNITRVKTGNCWAGQYTFNDPKTVTLSNDEWEILMKVFCFLQGDEYQCEQLTTMESPLAKDVFLAMLSEEKATKLLGDEIIKAIRYDTEHEIEFHGNTLSKLPSLALLEKKFDILEQESGVCENDE